MPALFPSLPLLASPRLASPRSGDGHINLREFRQALEFMGIYLTGSEFRKLWRQFDMSGDGKINYSEFNNKARPRRRPCAR